MAALHRLVREQMVAQNLANIEILGPSPAAVYRVKKKYRWNLGLLARRAKPLNTLARATREAFTKSTGLGKVELKIDLDPYGAF
jgi:primosomal protein N'